MEKIEDFFLNILDRIKLKKLADLYRAHREVMRYLVFGVLTTIINIVAYAVFYYGLKVPNLISNIIAWILSVIVAYLTNKGYVFHSEANTGKEILKEVSSFFASRIATLGIDELIMYIGVNLLNLNGTIMKIISNIVVIILNFIFSKLFVFKKKKNNKQG